MKRAASDLSRRESYFLLIDSIVPRPIAWVTTVSPEGVHNLAPFSFFTGLSAKPPTLVLCIATRVRKTGDGNREASPKDTLFNLRASGEFIVHVVPAALRSEVLRSAEDHPPEVDEASLLGLETTPGTWTDVPRLPALPVAMECRLVHELPLGEPPTTLVVGEVLGWHVDDAMVGEDGRVYSGRWDPLGRLGIEGFQD